MCGIGGYEGRADHLATEAILSAIAPRGPDARGTLDRGSCQLINTRLAIVDLSPTGAQPMTSSDGRIAVTYNGEIYNIKELRELLARHGLQPRGRCDTELVLLGFMALDTAIFAHLRGMFAVAIHDRRSDRLILARDHLGIKPLYYSTHGRFCFASSATGAARAGNVDTSLSHGPMRDFVTYRYVPTRETFWRGIRSLAPGHFLVREAGRSREEIFWSPPQQAEGGTTDLDEAAEDFGALFSEIVRENLHADVPVAVLLSGGVDSGAVLASAVRAGTRPTTFTYAMVGHDEVISAQATAARFGCEHVVITDPETDYEAALHAAVASMDVPVGDSIIVPTHRLLEAVGRRFKVVLTGEGADEMLGGYAHIRPLIRLGRLARTPLGARLGAHIARRLPASWLRKRIAYDMAIGPEERARIVGLIASADDAGKAVRMATSIFDEKMVPVTVEDSLQRDAQYTEHVHNLVFGELIGHGYSHWLPNQILRKMDQLSMSYGVEARVPFVDPRLVEVVSRISPTRILAGPSDKALLRRAVAADFPQWRAGSKAPFFQPMTTHHLARVSSVARSWLSPRMIRHFGVLEPERTAAALDRLSRGSFLGEKQVTALVCLHMWLDSHS